MFPFSLLGKVKQWFYKDKAAASSWDKCPTAFLTKFFPLGKTNALSAVRIGVNPRSTGKATRIHPSLSSSWDG
jgi:hypothetical protein